MHIFCNISQELVIELEQTDKILAIIILVVIITMDNKLDHLHSAYVELSRQVDCVVEAVERRAGDGPDAGAGVTGSRRPAGQASLYSVAMMIRSRPLSAGGGRKAAPFRSRKT